jgi:uncharacterized protein with HEPN domain
MPSSDPARRLRDIVQAIDDIEGFARGVSEADELQRNRLVARAVERCLQIISEAATKLGAEAEVLCPGQPWADIRGIGNHLRHAYDAINPSVVWHAIREELPALRRACEDALKGGLRRP